MAEPEVVVHNTNVAPVINKATIRGHDGYLCMIGEKGVFVFRDIGQHMGNFYDKIRICPCFVSKKGNVCLQFKTLRGKEREMMKTQERVGVTLELVQPLLAMIPMALGESDYSGNTPHVADPAEIEQDEIDGLLKQAGRVGR